MRIGLNISTVSGTLAGVGNYALNLARKLPVVAPDNEWVFFGPDPAFAQSLSGNGVRVLAARRTGLARVLWEQTGLPFEARRQRVDLLHGADFSRPVIHGGRMVNTVHGISAFSNEDYYPPAKRAYKRALTRFALRRSAAIITVSEFTRRQILERFAIARERVFAVHHGVEPARGVCEPKGEPPFILFVGTVENRKNLVPLVEAFRMLKTECRIPHRLVLAGRPGHGWETIRAAIENSKL
ncbi:MAG TPA: glycosyltransferase, partial [Terriglobia bacterium]|nr:glycosyltransferase [Terriglobia bacterium]